MSEPLRVAVIGARGIGKQHAKWYALSGCDVVAFVGTSEASCRKTQEAMERLFGFRGRAYWDVDRMLAEERPDLVDVCSPHELHSEHTLKALEAGSHVMCEKPMVWDGRKTPEEMLADGRAMVERAKAKGLSLGVSTQYAIWPRYYREIYERLRGPMTSIERLYVEMEALDRGRGKRYEEIWTDMGSHPLSILLSCLPDSYIEAGSLRCVLAPKENRTTFRFVSPGQTLPVEIVIRNLDEGTPIRRFGINGLLMDWEGRNDAAGVYRAVLRCGGQEWMHEDFMHTLLSRFAASLRGNTERTETPEKQVSEISGLRDREGRSVESVASGIGGEVIVSGETGLRNLELQLEILRQAERVGEISP